MNTEFDEYVGQNEELKLIDSINNALIYFEHLEDVRDKLEEVAKHIKGEYEEDIKVILNKINVLVEALEGTEDEEVVNKYLKGAEDLGKTLPKTKIERLGYSKEIITLLSRGETVVDIARRLSLTESSVKNFKKMYLAAKPIERIRIRKRSVFDIATNYEELGSMLYRSLAKLELIDPEHHVKYISEYRQLLVLADKFIKENTAKQKLEELGMLVKEVLISEMPEKRHYIINRLKEIGIGKALVGN